MYYLGLCKYTFAQRRNRLTTHFSARIPVVKRRISVLVQTLVQQSHIMRVFVFFLTGKWAGGCGYQLGAKISSRHQLTCKWLRKGYATTQEVSPQWLQRGARYSFPASSHWNCRWNYTCIWFSHWTPLYTGWYHFTAAPSNPCDVREKEKETPFRSIKRVEWNWRTM